MRSPRTPAALLAGGLLLLAVSACDEGPPPSESPSPSSGAAAALSVTTSVSLGAPGIEVTGVIPVAGSSGWDGADVMVDYHRTSVDWLRPAEGDVDGRRCRLSIDGRGTSATGVVTPLSPAAFTVVFRTGAASSAGVHRLRVVLALVGGDRVTCTWGAGGR